MLNQMHCTIKYALPAPELSKQDAASHHIEQLLKDGDPRLADAAVQVFIGNPLQPGQQQWAGPP